jgi:very-short-patch-repair endonuclease
MIESSKDHFCLQCNSKIDAKTFEYSLKKYKFPLCEDCQIWFIGKVFDTTKETIQLYFALRGRGVTAQLEKHDKLKRVDIAIEESHLHIEVDSVQQNYNVTEALQDLKKTYFDLPDGFFTLRVPNSLVKFNIDQTSDIIHKLIIDNKTRILSTSKKIAG